MRTHSLASVLVIALACGGGLVGCSVSTGKQKISDSSFVDDCAARLAGNATLNAHRVDVCKCIQDKLEAQGFGDRATADTSFASEARAAGVACGREVLGKQKISDPSFVNGCAARLVKNATLSAHRIEVCQCVQVKLEAQGFGNRAIADTSFESEARAAGATCARQVLGK